MEGFGAIFGSYQNCHGAGRHGFYYVNEYIVYFGVRFGSTSPTCWNQPVVASVLSIFSLPLSPENRLHRMCKM